MPVSQNLNLRVELIPEGKQNRPGTIIRPTHITIHNTDNDDPGADAQAHSGFVRNTGFYMLNGRKHWVSWHFTIDDKVAIRHLPLNELAYHAGSGNGVSVAIEICMHRGIDQAAANARAALLTASLLKDLLVPIENVVTHNKWTGKVCPRLLLNNETIGAKWRAFIDSVRNLQADMAGESGPRVLSPGEISSLESKRSLGMERIAPEDLEPEIDHGLVRNQLLAN